MDNMFTNPMALDPTALDLIAKGDNFEKEPVAVKINRSTNKGRRQRRRNEALKKAKIAQHSKCLTPYVCDDGYVKYPHSSEAKGFLKRVSNKKCRALSRRVSEDSPANIQNRKVFDLQWQLY